MPLEQKRQEMLAIQSLLKKFITSVIPMCSLNYLNVSLKKYTNLVESLHMDNVDIFLLKD